MECDCPSTAGPLRLGIQRATGIPATLLAAYLREHNIVPEKCDVNSILFLLTPAVEAGKSASLISRLVAFKKLYDLDAPLADVLPSTMARYPVRYAGYTLQRLCFRSAHFPEQAMTVQAASEALVGNQVD